jgi:hypothetical protein
MPPCAPTRYKSFQNKPNFAAQGKLGAVARQDRGQYKPQDRAPRPSLKGTALPMRFLTAFACLLLLAGCGSSDDGTRTMDSGTSIASGSSRMTLGVNSFLWHASLDTLSFMPLQSADPFGGVIISDWYVAPTAPNERLKVTIYIMDRTLRADGLKVVVFRQVRAGNAWSDAQPSPDTAHKLEDAILTRARELRLATVGSG